MFLLSNFQSVISTGSVARVMTGKKSNEIATHRWSIYLRGNDLLDDLSTVVSRVVFSLHPSFENPIRGKSSRYGFIYFSELKAIHSISCNLTLVA